MPRKKAPELLFQKHLADFLVREHKYGVLDQADITYTDHCIAEDQLWAFLTATQSETLKKLKDDYGADAREEIFRALRKELEHTPLWIILRGGLKVRGLEFRLFYPKPRSSESAAAKKFAENRVTFRPHFYFGETNQEVDFVFFLNGLPIVALEVKHEKNQNVHDAVRQFVARDQTRTIFRHPFLYLAADTSDVMAATDPSREENFRWHNTGIFNTPDTKGEYPVEFLYREVLAKDELLEALSFFLIRVPKHEAEEDKPERLAFTILPRYHQSRMVRKVSDDIEVYFAKTGEIGRKYLIDHSAGSGKTLSICWLADRLHSLYRPGTSEKLTDIVFILTDRKSLDTNIREDIEKFTHLKEIVGLARKAEDLPRFLAERKPIIVTTQQKFAWVLEQLEKVPELKKLRVGFLIDEAHRSQEGQMGAAIRVPFRKSGEADAEDAGEEGKDEEEKIAKIIREHDRNQLFVAFTATPAPATVTLFGAPFDSYTEAEAIAEGYIVDVAASIISYKTLYNLHCPVVPKLEEEKLYPKGIVANKFQTGFDEPLLAGMFLDKPVVDRNAVQTVSRLNRKREGKNDVVVVDFTNNAKAILKEFLKYRKGTPFPPAEPDKGQCPKLYAEILAAAVFMQKDAVDFVKHAAEDSDAKVVDAKGLRLAPGDLLDFDGMGDAKAALILVAIEFARRRIKPEGAKITTPADLLPHVRHYADRKKEHFLCASINGANEILNVRVVSIGLVDRSPVHPREVFADALSDRASAVIVAHNHPAGSLEPSPSDVDITAQLKVAGAVVGVTLLDHIIFNRTEYFSFLEAGCL